MILRGGINPFAGIVARPDALQAVLAQPEPAHRFVIYFTPRSSSTRLTEILGRTRRLGEANEAFNPTFVRTNAMHWQVADMDSYIALLLRRQAPGGVYSCEVTAHHLNVLFADERPFVRAFGTAPSFWLIRQDIVAQAVSLAKMVATGVSHSPFATPAAMAAAETGFDYDRAAILHWLRHIWAAETAQEAFFARHRIAPLRLSYEQVTLMEEARIIDVFTRHAALPAVALPPPTAARQHLKIATARNDSYAARFRIEAASELAAITAERASRLASLHDLDATIPTAAELRAALPPEPLRQRLLKIPIAGDVLRRMARGRRRLNQLISRLR